MTTIVSMTCREVLPHPDADALQVLRLEAPEVPDLVVVANLETRYTAGDHVAVARVGTTLLDGTVIRKARLRGVESFGMALGVVQDAPGTDLTARLGKPTPPSDKPSLVTWSDLGQLHGLRFTLLKRAELGEPLPRVTYRAKVKLDGTNAAIHALPGGGFAAQSRTRLLEPGDDNYGFAAWTHGPAAAFCASLHERLGRAVVFGEWCGRGIQGRTAICQIDRPVLAVFAVAWWGPFGEERLLVEPDELRTMLPEHPDVYVLPWHGEPVDVHFDDPAHVAEAAERINAMVAEVEACDPWVAGTFGVRGLGEGVVLYPVGRGDDRESLTSLMFKAKGEGHRVSRQKQPAQVDPEVARGVDDFVELMVTPARLRQGLEQITGGQMDLRRMGELLRWIGQDVQKESVAELAAANLEWKQVAKAVTQAAQKAYRAML